MRTDEQDIYACYGPRHWWLTGRYAIIRSLFRQYCRRGSSRLLDAGCGPAVLRSFIRETDAPEYTGIDVSLHGLRLACADKEDKPFAAGDLTSLPLRDSQYDAVAAVDVIEHIKDDSRALREVRRVLRPAGKVFLCVPAFQFLWAAYDDRYGHYRRYTKQSLGSLLEDNGFTIRDIVYGQTLFFLPALIMRRMKQKEHSADSGFTHVSRLSNLILHAIMLLDFYIFRKIRLPFGCNIFCVAEKR